MNPATKQFHESFAALSQACFQNLPLDVRLPGEQTTETYRSRFLRSAEDAEPGILTIEAPTLRGNIVLLRPGQEIKVIFAYERIIHSFTTTVISRGRHQLNNEMTVSSLHLQWPEAISIGKIRSFYRLPIPEKNRMEVSLGIYSQTKNKSRRVRARENAVLTDIGGGGLGFRIAEGRSLLMGVDTRLFLSFCLPGDEESIKLVGRICFYLRRKDLREVFFGVQFIDIESDILYKRNVDKILRYVAEQQRLSLSYRID